MLKIYSQIVMVKISILVKIDLLLTRTLCHPFLQLRIMRHTVIRKLLLSSVTSKVNYRFESLGTKAVS